jgi:hypothetical protein
MKDERPQAEREAVSYSYEGPERSWTTVISFR